VTVYVAGGWAVYHGLKCRVYGKSWIFYFKIPGSGKSWKLKIKVLESHG